MGSYGIGVGRLLACVAEEHNDEHGLLWPVSSGSLPGASRFDGWQGRGRRNRAGRRGVVPELRAAGLEPLYDDRDESPGSSSTTPT
jgi:prolyl-tRNA synthetase